MSTLIIKYFFYIVSFILFFKFELTRYSDQLINVKFFNIGLNNVFTFAPSSLHQQLYKCAAPIPHSPFYKLKNEEKKNIYQNYTEHSNMYFRDSIKNSQLWATTLPVQLTMTIKSIYFLLRTRVINMRQNPKGLIYLNKLIFNVIKIPYFDKHEV